VSQTSIRLAATKNDLDAIFAFRYRIYIDEMGRKQKYADHALRLIRDPLDDTGYNILASSGGSVVGCVRVNLGRDGGLDYYRNLLNMDAVGKDCPTRVALCTRLMVAPKFRKSTLAVRLSAACFDIGFSKGVLWNFIDCNDHLVGFFTKLGYEYLHKCCHEEYGEVNAMRFNLSLDALRSNKSIFLHNAERIIRAATDPVASLSWQGSDEGRAFSPTG